MEDMRELFSLPHQSIASDECRWPCQKANYEVIKKRMPTEPIFDDDIGVFRLRKMG
jgi:hypothetical protein